MTSETLEAVEREHAGGQGRMKQICLPDETSDDGEADISDDESDISETADEDIVESGSADEAQEPANNFPSPGFGQPLLEVSVPRLIDPPDCRHASGNEEKCHYHWKETYTSKPMLEDCGCQYRPRADYEAVRILSQISKQFTRELGRVLWQNATVEFEEPHAFFLFFRERPAVLRLVKHVVLHLHCYGNSLDDSTPVVGAICDFMSTEMDLRFLTIRLTPVFPIRA